MFLEMGPFLIDVVPILALLFCVWLGFRAVRRLSAREGAGLDRMRAATEAIKLLNARRRQGQMTAQEIEREMRKSWPSEWALMTADWWGRQRSRQRQ